MPVIDTAGPIRDAPANPLLSVAISAPSQHLSGWVVVDSLVDGLAMGGTRLTDSVTEEEVRELARAMTTKLALVGLPIGGAKAGIRTTPGSKDAVLAAFGQAVAPLLHGGVYLGCDMGTTYADRDTVFDAAGYAMSGHPRARGLPVDWGTFWAHMGDITGYGVSVAALTALGDGFGARTCRVVLQGFGTVGRAVGRHLERHGHRVIAVADVLGTLHCPDGLPVDDLTTVTDSSGSIDRSRLPEAVRRIDTPDAWLNIDADLLVLAATKDAVHPGNAERVRAGYVVEGGNLCCTPTAKTLLANRGVIVVPDVVANVGAAAVTGCVLTGTAPCDLDMHDTASWMFTWVGERVARNCRDILEIAASMPGDPISRLQAQRRDTAV